MSHSYFYISDKVLAKLIFTFLSFPPFMFFVFTFTTRKMHVIMMAGELCDVYFRMITTESKVYITLTCFLVIDTSLINELELKDIFSILCTFQTQCCSLK